MESGAMKIVALLITSVMSFLGWNVSEYTPLLPQIIVKEIELISTSTVITLPPLETRVEVAPKPIQKTPAATKPVPTPTVTPVTPSSPTPIAEPKPEPVPKLDVNLSGEAKIRAATVNIYCTRPVGGGQIAHHSGSGVVIDPSGVVITNAHVAEHVMLEQAKRETCHIRTGSPAKNSYKAKVIYLPQAWIEANKFNLNSVMSGNGESDYAFLQIISRVSQSAYDVPLPYLAPDTSDISVGATVTIAGYPIITMSASILAESLYGLTDPSTVQRTFGYTPATNNDVINTGASSLAKSGTSGGAIVSSGGNLIGIVNSAVIDPNTGGQAVQAITLSYINRSLQSQGKSIRSLIDNAISESDSFAQNKVQLLSSML